MRGLLPLLCCLCAAAFASDTRIEPYGPTLVCRETPYGYVPMENLLYKMQKGEKITIGVIGDSIGYGQVAGSTTIQGITYSTRPTPNGNGTPKANPMSYARVLTDYLKDYAKANYGMDDAKIDTFYSVWGGATAMSSLGYASDDIVAYRPDVVLVEIWNLYGDTSLYLESILQILYAANPHADVILLGVGGAFGKFSAETPLVAKYGIPYSDGNRYLDSWFAQFGTFHADARTVSPDGKIDGTRGYYFGPSYPHVNEEGYAYWCQIFTRDLERVFKNVADNVAARGQGKQSLTFKPAQPEARRLTVDADGVPVYPTDTIAERSALYFASEVCSPAFVNGLGVIDAEAWTVSDPADPAEPMDTADRAQSHAVTARTPGAAFTMDIHASAVRFVGGNGISFSTDGGATWQAVKPGDFYALGEADADLKLTVKAAAKGNAFNEFYLFGHDYRPVAMKQGKHRYSAVYYGKLQSKFIHDWQIGGIQVLPKFLTWINVFRDETYTGELTVASTNVINNQVEANGDFVGWLEADSVTWDKGEKIPYVDAYRYDAASGKVFDAKFGKEKCLYRPGDELVFSKLGRDLDLVAAYSCGRVSLGYAKTCKATFVTENSTAGSTVCILEGKGTGETDITLPPALSRHLYAFKGWKAVNTDAVLNAGGTYRLAADTEFVGVWELDAKNNTGVTRKDDGSVAVNYARRNAGLADTITAVMTGFQGTFTPDEGQKGVGRFHGHNFNFDVRFVKEHDTDCFQIDSLGGAYWQFPAVRGECIIPVTPAEAQTVIVDYFYNSPNATNLVGQHMALYVTAPSGDGLSYYTFCAASDETLVVDQWSTLTFRLSYAYAKSAENPRRAGQYASAKDSFITRTLLYFYDVNLDTGRPPKPFPFLKGDRLLVGDYVFSSK